MKIPTIIPTFPLSMTHGFTGNFGSINISMTIPLNRTKYLNGESLIESISDSALQDFKSQIQYHTREIN